MGGIARMNRRELRCQSSDANCLKCNCKWKGGKVIALTERNVQIEKKYKELVFKLKELVGLY